MDMKEYLKRYGTHGASSVLRQFTYMMRHGTTLDNVAKQDKVVDEMANALEDALKAHNKEVAESGDLDNEMLKLRQLYESFWENFDPDKEEMYTPVGQQIKTMKAIIDDLLVLYYG